MGLMTYSRRLGRRHLERSLAIWKSVSPPLAEPVANYEVIAPDPAKVSKRIPRLPDPHLIPDYSGLPSRTQSHVGDPFQEPVIWTGEQIEGIRKACQLARTFLSRAAELVEPGTPTEAIDAQVHELIVASDSYPSPLNFEGFPRSISTSVNNVACHGVPDGRPLKDGDLITIDVTVFHKGYHGDTSKTWIVGEKRSEQGRRLVNGAQECLFQGIAACGPGESFQKIGLLINRHARKRHLKVVPNLCGHGIGTFFHGPPSIYHTLNNYPGVMKPGMVFTIEPCLSDGVARVSLCPEDGRSLLTTDQARTAQFEHTILVTEVGVEILTA